MKYKNIRNTILVAVMALCFSGQANAAANCAGTVALILKWDNQCNGELAYILNDGTGMWLCARDNTEAAILLTAQASGANILARLSDSNLTLCSQNTTQYTTPSYMVITTAP